MNQLSDYEKLSLEKLEKSIYENKWSNDGLVKLVQLIEQYLQPISIQKYANNVGKSYNGIKKTKQITILLGHKFIINNE